MAAALDVARHLIKLSGVDPDGIEMDALRLQKLLYYVQGWTIAWTGQPAFDETLRAWIHGPVVPEVWREFHDERKTIRPNEARDPENLSPDLKRVIRSVWEGYKRYSSQELRQMTHDEPPWSVTRGDLPEDTPSDAEIPLDLVSSYFIEEAQKKAIPGLEPEAMKQAEEDFAAGRTVTFDQLLANLSDGI